MKVLYVLASLTQGNGVLTFCWNYLREHPADVIPAVLSFDDKPSKDFLDFCRGENIPVCLLPNPKKIGFLKFKHFVADYFNRNHNFDILHCNIPNYGFVILKEAKKNAIKIRILHSHNSESSDSLPKKILNKAGMFLTRKEANVYFACSDVAGKFAFNKRPFTFIPNAIDQSLFRYSKTADDYVRKTYGISDHSFVIGFVGRLAKQKNPFFLLDVFSFFHAKHNDSFLLIVGDGPLRAKMDEKIKKRNLTHFVIFTGSKANSSIFYSSFDVFLLPSLFEGLPFSGVEVQSVGVPSIFSTGSNSQLIFRNNAELLSLQKGPKEWSDEIENIIRKSNEIIEEKNQFDIKEQSVNLFQIYKNLLHI